MQIYIKSSLIYTDGSRGKIIKQWKQLRKRSKEGKNRDLWRLDKDKELILKIHSLLFLHLLMLCDHFCTVSNSVGGNVIFIFFGLSVGEV